MIQFLYVLHLSLVAYYGIVYSIVIIEFLLGRGDDALDEQRELRLKNVRSDSVFK